MHTREPEYRLRSKLVTSLCPVVARVSYELAKEEEIRLEETLLDNESYFPTPREIWKFLRV